MITILLIVFAVGAFLFIVNGYPDTFRIARSRVIDAPAEEIFRHVEDLHLWQAWSPWAKLDPNAKNEFSGPEKGVGASLYWSGNRQVGEGRMTISEASAPHRIAFRLQFIKPIAADNEAEFTFTPDESGGTRVTWSMTGRNSFTGKIMGMVVNCDKMLGASFEKGLDNLAAVVQSDRTQS